MASEFERLYPATGLIYIGLMRTPDQDSLIGHLRWTHSCRFLSHAAFRAAAVPKYRSAGVFPSGA